MNVIETHLVSTMHTAQCLDRSRLLDLVVDFHWVNISHGPLLGLFNATCLNIRSPKVVMNKSRSDPKASGVDVRSLCGSAAILSGVSEKVGKIDFAPLFFVL